MSFINHYGTNDDFLKGRDVQVRNALVGVDNREPALLGFPLAGFALQVRGEERISLASPTLLTLMYAITGTAKAPPWSVTTE